MSESFWKRAYRAVFRPSASHMTGRMISKMILTSLKLHPVALLAQFAGMTSLVATFWQSEVSRVFLLVWYAFGLAQIYFALRYVRYFWQDRDRVARIRIWVRRWTALAIAAGIIWGVAGPSLMLPLSGISQVVTVAVVVAVTFASWPVYSCWLPSLTGFTLLSLIPLMVTFAVQFGISEALMVLVMIVSCAFILYSGRKLNEMVLASILTDDKNRRLVERLKVEVNQSEKARRQAEHLSERRSRFFAAANHDIRQPLQAMGIYLDLLRRRSTPATAPIVEELVHTSESISTLVEQVLTVTRMEFGRLDLHPEVIALPEFLEELVQECRPIAEKRGLSVRFASVPVSITTDRLMLKRALKNLVSNAIAYSDAAKARVPEIVIGARRLGNGDITIGVYDSGPGLSAEDKTRLFETFYRGSAGKQQPSGGFGLGLSIVKGIAGQLDAKLSVGSKPGRGSVFRLTFAKHETLDEKRNQSGATKRALRPSWHGTVLLLEDNTMVANAIGEMMRGWGARVQIFHAPDEAFFSWVEAEIEKVELFITDFNLGEDVADGFEVLAKVHHMVADDEHAPVNVLLTAVARDLIETRWEELEDSGATGDMRFPAVLQKPVDESDLLALLPNEKTSEKIGA